MAHKYQRRSYLLLAVYSASNNSLVSLLKRPSTGINTSASVVDVDVVIAGFSKETNSLIIMLAGVVMMAGPACLI